MGKLPNTPPSLKAWEDGQCEKSLTGQEFTLIKEVFFLDLHFRFSLRNTLVVLANSMDNANTCFKKWHNSVNLKRESKQKQQALIK